MKALLAQQQGLFALHPIPSILINQDGLITDWNDASVELLGYTRLQTLGKNFNVLLLSDDDLPLFKASKKQAIFKIHHANGNLISCEVNLRHFDDHYLVTLNDITAYQQLEEKFYRAYQGLKDNSHQNDNLYNLVSLSILAPQDSAKKNSAIIQSEKRLRLLAENATDMISLQSADGIYLYVSPSCKHILGYDPEQLRGKHCYDFFHEADRVKILKTLSQIKSDTDSNTITHRFKRKDGTFAWFETTHRFIRDSKTQEIIEVHATSRDITTRILEERARLKSQKLAQVYRLNTMEEMASGIAHEVNQPLAAVVNYTRGCVRYLENHKHLHDKKLIEIMEKAVSQAERAGEIVHRLKNFFSKGEMCKAPEKINRIIKEAVNLLKKDITNQRTKIVYKFGRKLPTLFADKIQLQQVVLNLLQNALESMEDTPSSKRQITIKTSFCNNMIEVIVSDTGPGFTQELIEKVYQPFFTTKKTGTGMGLPICRSIIEAHNGNFMIRAPKYKKEGWVCFTIPLGKRKGEQ